MTNEITTFMFKNNSVRSMLIDNVPWFVGKDVAEILGYANASKAIADHVDTEDKLNNDSLSSLGQRGGWIINESGLYSLILGSKLPSAKEFKRWITSEVLPTIRKHGIYANASTIKQLLTNPDSLITILQTLQQESEGRRKAETAAQEAYQIIEKNKPKVQFADAVARSTTDILVGDLAKIVHGYGLEIGQNRLFEWLRGNGYLISRKDSSSWNMPTQRSMNAGLFHVKESVVYKPDGTTAIYKTTKVTGKGQQVIIDALVKYAERLDCKRF